jgi:hypothetical protein
MINCAAGKNIHFVPLLFFEDVNCVHGKLLPRDAGAKRFICAPLFFIVATCHHKLGSRARFLIEFSYSESEGSEVKTCTIH